MTLAPYHLYFHAPCFDGIISAVLMHEFLTAHEPNHPIVLHPANYHLNETWATSRLEQPAAIVDFLYHPDAAIWFDHHRTSFQSLMNGDELSRNEAFHQNYLRRRGPTIVFEPTFSSCARLIWQFVQNTGRVGDHREKVEAADVIDSAGYRSPEEVVYGDTPAMRIYNSMAIGSPRQLEDYSAHLVIELLNHSLKEVAESPEVVERFSQFRKLNDLGLERWKNARPEAPPPDEALVDYAGLEDDGIFVFNIDGSNALIGRYFPFVVAPQARYSVGLVRNGSEGTIRAMRNPWIEFSSVDLSKIFGSGHQRVASRRLHDITPERGESKLREIVRAIQQEINTQQKAGAAAS